MKKLLISLLLLTLLFPSFALAAEQRTHTITDLTAKIAELNQDGKWVRSYSPDTFDCSNMAASLDTILDKEGFYSLIVWGHTYKWQYPYKAEFTRIIVSNHAMLLVFTTDEWGGVNLHWIDPSTMTITNFYGFHPYFIPVEFYATAKEAEERHRGEFVN